MDRKYNLVTAVLDSLDPHSMLNPKPVEIKTTIVPPDFDTCFRALNEAKEKDILVVASGAAHNHHMCVVKDDMSVLSSSALRDYLSSVYGNHYAFQVVRGLEHTSCCTVVFDSQVGNDIHDNDYWLWVENMRQIANGFVAGWIAYGLAWESE